MRHCTVWFVGVSLALTFSVADAGAECVGFPLDHYVKHADAIFMAVVTDVEQLDWRRSVVHVAVSRVWKGSVSKRAVLHQVLESTVSFRFPEDSVGKEYLVFASRLSAPHRAAFELQEKDEVIWPRASLIRHTPVQPLRLFDTIRVCLVGG